MLLSNGFDNQLDTLAYAKKEGEYIVFLTQGGREVCRIKDEAGGENLTRFGLIHAELQAFKEGSYFPWDIVKAYNNVYLDGHFDISGDPSGFYIMAKSGYMLPENVSYVIKFSLLQCEPDGGGVVGGNESLKHSSGAPQYVFSISKQSGATPSLKCALDGITAEQKTWSALGCLIEIYGQPL